MRQTFPAASTTPPAGSQTLLRGLDLIEAVKTSPATLNELCERLALNRSTVHRLATSLVQRGYLRFLPGEGYFLGAELLALGQAARLQIGLTQAAHPHLQGLSDQTDDAVHLGVLESGMVLYLEKLPGRRRIEIGSRVGERQPLTSTGIGRALLLDTPMAELAEIYRQEAAAGVVTNGDIDSWLKAMLEYQSLGCTFDLEDSEDRIRCVGGAIRDMTGAIVAAISVSSAAQYMDNARMHLLGTMVRDTATAISRDLGWRSPPTGGEHEIG